MQIDYLFLFGDKNYTEMWNLGVIYITRVKIIKIKFKYLENPDFIP